MNNVLPLHSKVWVYQSVNPFNETETQLISEKIKLFVQQWTAHKEQVTGDGFVMYNRFVVLMADESEVGVSGCSMDASVHFIKGLAAEFNTNFFDRWNIAYMENEKVLSCNSETFEKLVESGKINDDTVVFNNLVQTKKDFETSWKISYAKSWLKNLAQTHTAFSSVL